MKPFDLEAAKRGEPIVSRDGREVKFVAHVPEANAGHRLVVLCDEVIYSHYVDGRYHRDAVDESSVDLFMATKKFSVWVNLYSDGYWTMQDTQEDADEHNNFYRSYRIGKKAFKMEIEE